MARRHGKVWVSGQGWVFKKETEDRNYDDLINPTGAFVLWVFRWYPDKLLDIIRDDDADYKNLELVQRVMMRVFARYKNVAITGGRGISKTYTKFCQKGTDGLVWPETQSSYYGPSYKQMADIASKTFRQIVHEYPLMGQWWHIAAESKDDFKITSDTSSAFYISAMRGDNIHDVTAEEFAQEDGTAPFDHATFRKTVLPAIRLWHNVNGEQDPNFVGYRRHSITSAGRKQNQAYLTRCATFKAMANGESAFAMDISYEVVLLQQMRTYDWVLTNKDELTVEEWMREMESIYTGESEFPMLTDDTMLESSNLMVMERQHCCKYPGCVTRPEDVIYVLGYDVSYENNAKNAKCAVAVLKLTKQKTFLKRNRYLKQLVYIDDWPPPDNQMVQARKLKDLWERFSFDGSETYIAIDSWQYGRSVVEDLMIDLGDGLPPLCVYEHRQYVEAEQEGAIPVIYPIKAGGNGVTDPDFEMIKYAQSQFENHNVELLTMNNREGVDAYKRAHKIKTDERDWSIVKPYQKTQELRGQIQNLKLKPSGTGMTETRISKSIQRDSWSALKYALRFAQILERKYLSENQRTSDWDVAFKGYGDGKMGKVARRANAGVNRGSRRMASGGRHGGRRF